MECPHCRGEVTLSPKQLGQTWTCPHCRRAFHASRPAGARRATAATGASRRVVRCRSCFHKYFLAGDATDDKCPACGVASAPPALVGGLSVAAGGSLAAQGHGALGPFGASAEVEIAQMYAKLGTIQRCLKISAVLNVIGGSLWTLTLVGAVVGVPLLTLAYFELRHRARYGSMSPYAFASRTRTIAFVELVLAFGSAFALVTAIANLVLAGQVQAICERYGLTDATAAAEPSVGSANSQAQAAAPSA